MSMKLRNLLLGLMMAVFTVSFTSCDDDDYYYYEDRIPDYANDFLYDYFPYDAIVDIDVYGHGTGTSYEVDLASGAVVYFDYYGYWYYIEMGWGDALPYGVLPRRIENYIAKYCYPHYAISAEIQNWGYEIGLSDGYSINFDENGNPF